MAQARIEELASGKMRVSEGLRRVYASHGHSLSDEQRIWIENEMNGYPNDSLPTVTIADLRAGKANLNGFPEYRRPLAGLRINYPNGTQGQVTMQDPVGSEALCKPCLPYSVSAIEDMLDRQLPLDFFLNSQNSAIAARDLNLDPRMPLSLRYDRSAFVGIIENVRSRLIKIVKGVEKHTREEVNLTAITDQYDVFVCHVSEDKESIARPLAVALREAGLRVWFDEFELTVGDSLKEKIDAGLRSTKYGVVILSPRFLQKRKWNQKELSALFAREIGGRKVILPVWHEVTEDLVKQHELLLADKLAVSTDRGIDHVVQELVKAVGKRNQPSKSAKDDAISPPTRPSQPFDLARKLKQKEDARTAEKKSAEEQSIRAQFVPPNAKLSYEEFTNELYREAEKANTTLAEGRHFDLSRVKNNPGVLEFCGACCSYMFWRNFSNQDGLVRIDFLHAGENIHDRPHSDHELEPTTEGSPLDNLAIRWKESGFAGDKLWSVRELAEYCLERVVDLAE